MDTKDICVEWQDTKLAFDGIVVKADIPESIYKISNLMLFLTN